MPCINDFFDLFTFICGSPAMHHHHHSLVQVKHGRMAMVAAAGWIGAELADNYEHLASGGRVPTVLNGHLTDWQNFIPFLAIFGAWSYLEHQVCGSMHFLF